MDDHKDRYIDDLLLRVKDLEDKITELENPAVVCTFCGTHVDYVNHMIAGPGCFICDKCVDLCAQIIKEKTDENTDA